MNYFIYKIRSFRVFLLALTLSLLTDTMHAQVSKVCPNAGVENGNMNFFSGWIGSYSGASNLADINSGLSLNSTALPSGQRISLCTPGMDPLVPVQKVYAGNYSIRLGSTQARSQAERITYKTIITNSNKIFRYNYAVVLEIPDLESHDLSERPFFSARIMVRNRVICETGRKTAGNGDPFFQTFNGLNYRDWDCQVCDLTRYVGDTVTVEFTVAGCSPGAHFGYAYIDGLCDNGVINVDYHLNKDKFCLDEDITMDATATVGENYYYLTLEESDANGGRPNPASEMILHFPNATVGVENITDIFTQHGFQFQCNTYYRLKLAVGNTCSPWNELVKVIYISCPEVHLGRDICVDCNKPQISRLIPIGDPNAPVAAHLDYSWSPPLGISDPNAPYTTHMENSVNYPITYTLNVMDLKTGCRNADQITVQCTVTKGEIVKESTCCGIILRLRAPSFYTDIEWSNGATGVSEILVTEAGNYTVTYSNSCSSVSSDVVVTAQDIANIERYYKDLSDNNLNHFYSSGSNLNSYNAFYIMHVENPLPSYGNYFATAYKLDIFDRWGALIRTIESEITDCHGFDNPAIMWDGTVNGVNVPVGVYNARLSLKNCRFQNWETVRVTYCEEWGYTCEQYDCIFWMGAFECGFFKKNECVQVSDYHCITDHTAETFPITIVF